MSYTPEEAQQMLREAFGRIVGLDSEARAICDATFGGAQ